MTQTRVLDAVAVLQRDEREGVGEQEQDHRREVERGRVVEALRHVAVEDGAAAPAQGLASGRHVHDAVHAVAGAAGDEAVGRVARQHVLRAFRAHRDVSHS
jgi:hypothetical protein